MKSKYFGMKIFKSDCRTCIYKKNTAHNNKELIKLSFSATAVLVCLIKAVQDDISMSLPDVHQSPSHTLFNQTK